MQKLKLRLGNAVFAVVLAAAAIIFIAPILWMLSTALKEAEDIFVMPPQWIPDPVVFSNFADVFTKMDFLQYLKNTIWVSVLPVFGQLLAVPLVVYSITKIEWKGAKIIFPLVLVTMMIPWQVTQIPMYTTWSKLGFVNTFIPLVLPAFFGSPYYIYLMRQFMKGIPNSLIDAARIDGANDLTILYRVVMPLCKPILVTVALLVFIAAWNDFNGPLMYLQESDKYTLSVGLQNVLSNNTLKRQYNLVMAAVTLFSLPLMVVFAIFQKQFISGIATGGVKG
ncbi:carbohydrate ABC transporter permease [Candidatus Allofournierella merdipullorum]|uniref:carbohydrate ABC transporter permease n=1 Tax=Candidatus Allofournierella merdipullorum TaxID=2838595 RepID=UPI002A8BC917|nr:carbohydrate ABC transporter permease [Candidatus Fournierella merdipullorum]